MFCFCFFFCVAGGKYLNNEANLPMLPIHIVTDASQLPAEFLDPSPTAQLIIGFDCEGVDLCRHGTLCVMQVHCASFFERKERDVIKRHQGMPPMYTKYHKINYQ